MCRRVVHRADSGLRQSWQLPAAHFGCHILCLCHKFAEPKILLLSFTKGGALCVHCRSVDLTASHLCRIPHLSHSCVSRSSQPCPPKHIHPSSTLFTSRKVRFIFSPGSMRQENALWSIPPQSLELPCYSWEDHHCKLDRLQPCGAQHRLPLTLTVLLRLPLHPRQASDCCSCTATSIWAQWFNSMLESYTWAAVSVAVRPRWETQRCSVFLKITQGLTLIFASKLITFLHV